MIVSLLLFVALIAVFVFSGGGFKRNIKVTTENTSQIVADFVESQGVEAEVLGTVEDEIFL